MIVSDEVRKVGDSITEIIVDLCSTSSQNSRIFLNAPDYLFISTNIAKKFPNLMESIVIQSYFNHIPGELSKLWKNNNYNRIRQNNHNNIWINNIRSLTTIFSLLQYFGTLPIILHKLFIRFIQPFLFGGLTLIWSIIITNTLYIIITCSLFFILIACSIYQYIRSVSTKSSNNLCLITPMINEVHDKNVVIVNDVDLLRNEIIPIIHLDMREFDVKQDNSGSDDDYNIDYDDDEAVSEDDDDEDDKEDEEDDDEEEEDDDDDDEKSFDNINTDQTIEINDDESDNNCESPRLSSSSNTVSSMNIIEEVSESDNSEGENDASDSEEEEDDEDNDDDGDDDGGCGDESCIDSDGDCSRRGKGRVHNKYAQLRDKSHERNEQKSKSENNNDDNSNSSTSMSSSCYNDWITDEMYAEMLKEITTHDIERTDH
jgi:hypothetical protein